MEQRRIEGKSHWYHETQSSTYPQEVLPLVPEAANVEDSFLLDLAIAEDVLLPFRPGCTLPVNLLNASFPSASHRIVSTRSAPMNG